MKKKLIVKDKSMQEIVNYIKKEISGYKYLKFKIDKNGEHEVTLWFPDEGFDGFEMVIFKKIEEERYYLSYSSIYFAAEKTFNEENFKKYNTESEFATILKDWVFKNKPGIVMREDGEFYKMAMLSIKCDLIEVEKFIKFILNVFKEKSRNYIPIEQKEVF